jgi:hypothetical protein
MLTPQAIQGIQGIQFVFNVSFFFFRIELGTKTHGFRYFGVFLGNAVKAYCDWLVNFRTSLIFVFVRGGNSKWTKTIVKAESFTQ